MKTQKSVRSFVILKLTSVYEMLALGERLKIRSIVSMMVGANR
jgi:hypothetical protein